MISLGKYRHFKGNEYKVVHIAKHSETEEDMVVYYPLYGNIEKTGEPEYWVRPLTIFNETVEKEGKSVKRFTFISSN